VAPRIKLLFLLAGSFVLLAPISVGTGSTVTEGAKYLRLATTLVIVGTGLFNMSRMRFGPGSRALFAFVLLFVGSSLWSNLPLWALLNKSMFGFTCLSGLVLAGSLRSASDMREGFRFLGMIAAAAAIVALGVFLKDPSGVSTHDRMAVFGVNPNMIGHTASPLSILCMYVAINDRRRLWKVLMIGACCILGLIIIATGCRGAALTMMIGTACLVAPHTRRPGVLVGVLVCAALTAFIGFEVLDIGGNDRMLNEIGKNTRSGIWNWAFRIFHQSPLIGCGWMHVGRRSATVQSMYMQVLAETGIVGVFVLLVTLLIVAASWLGGFSRLKQWRLPTGTGYFALALVMVELVHGLTESSPVVGTMMSALDLGLGIGLADRLVDLADVARPSLAPSVAAARIVPRRRRPSAMEVLEALRQKEQRVPAPPAE
jgi:O-antigen ligase